MNVRKLGLFLLAVYFLVCFTAVVDGIFIAHSTMFGYLERPWLWFWHLVSSVSDSIVRFLLRAIAVGIFILFIPGTLAGMLAVLVLLVVLGSITFLVGMAGTNPLAAIIVIAFFALLFTVLIRKYWQPIAEAVAWVTVLCEGISEWSQGDVSTKTAPALLVKRFNASHGGISMDNEDDRPASGLKKAEGHQIQLGDMLRPHSAIGSIKAGIKARMAAKTYSDQAEMVSNANRLGREILTSYDLETEADNRPMKRGEQSARQELSTLQAKAALEDFQDSRAQKAKEPKNPITRQYETEYLPIQQGELRKGLDAAHIRAQAVLEAAQTVARLQKEVDSNPEYSEDLRKTLKRQIRAQFNDLLGKNDE